MSYTLKAGHIYSFGGWIFPAPAVTALGSTYEEFIFQNYSFIVKMDGEFYFFVSDYVGGWGLNAYYKDDGWLACWSKISYLWKLDGDVWVSQDPSKYNTEENNSEYIRGGYLICPKQCLLWAGSNVGNLLGFSLYMPDYDGNYMDGSAPVYLGESFDFGIVSPDTVKRGGGLVAYCVADYDDILNGSYVDYEMTLSGQGEINPLYRTELLRNENCDDDGTISSVNYTLYCGKYETAETLTLTATPISAPWVTATKTITVYGEVSDDDDDAGGDDTGEDSESTDEQLRLAFLKGVATAKALFGGGG